MNNDALEIPKSTKAPLGYKQTALGLIPSDWDVKKLGEIAKIKHGKDQKQIICDDGIYPILGTGGEIGRTNSFLYDKPSVLIGRKGTIDKPRFMDTPFWTVDTLFYTEISSDLEPKWLFYKFQTINWYLYNEASTVPSLIGSTISSIKLSVPSLMEQQKIAALLSTWDVVIDNCKNIIDKISFRNKGLEQQFLSGKIRVKGFEKTQWHLKSVDEVAVFKNGKAHENCIDEEGDYFVVNSKFISTQGKVAKASNENLCPLFKNDITMVMSDIPNGKAFAKCFYIPEDDKYTLNQRICALTARKGTDSKFLYYQMNRNNYYLAFNNGVSQTNLKKEEVLECPLLMPDIEEQIQIVKLIDTATEELNQYQQKLEALQLQKKGLMQQLLTGKTRVKI